MAYAPRSCPQLSYLPRVALVAVLIMVVTGSQLNAKKQQPPLLPTRDVDIIYTVSQPHHPVIVERVRWLASEHLERVDGPDRSATIFDRKRREITLLNPASRTFLRIEGTARQPAGPEKGTLLKHGTNVTVAGLRCVDWSWVQDVERHTACLTPDGVLLRLVVDGKTVMEARSVRYRRQRPELFQVPHNYSPALAPGGASGSRARLDS